MVVCPFPIPVFPKECTRMHTHTHKLPHQQLLQVKVSIRAGLLQTPEHSRVQNTPGFRAVQEARHKSSRWAGQAALAHSSEGARGQPLAHSE